MDETEVLKIIVEGFDEAKKDRLEIKEDVAQVKMRLFGSTEYKVESMVTEVEKNKDRSQNNKRLLEQILPQHKEMHKFYSNLKGIVVGYTLLTMGVGAATFKLIGWLLQTIIK